MRNFWFPNKRAEYMTAARFAELGLSRGGAYERDPIFGIGVASKDVGEDADELEVEEARPGPTVRVQTVAVCPLLLRGSPIASSRSAVGRR